MYLILDLDDLRALAGREFQLNCQRFDRRIDERVVETPRPTGETAEGRTAARWRPSGRWTATGKLCGRHMAADRASQNGANRGPRLSIPETTEHRLLLEDGESVTIPRCL